MIDGMYLSAERTGVRGVLGDFHLLDLLTERRTVSHTVFTDDSSFLGTFLFERYQIEWKDQRVVEEIKGWAVSSTQD